MFYYKLMNTKKMKKTFTLILLGGLLFFGVESASADKFSGGNMYFDNTSTNWSADYQNFVIGSGSYSEVRALNNITNTKAKVAPLPTSGWNDATYMAVVFTTTSWGSGSWGSSNLTNATYYSKNDIPWDWYSGGGTFILTPGSTETNLDVTYKGTDHTALNFCAQTVGIKVVGHDGVAVVPDNAPAALSGTGYKYSAWNACGTTANNSVAADAEETTMEVGGGFCAYVKLAYSDVASGYAFIGWYDKDGKLLSSSNNYEYYPNAAAEVYAYFRPTTYTRAITLVNGEKWGTICLPYSVASDGYSGADLYSIAGKRVDGSGNPTSLVLTEETGALTAGRPYIFHATTDAGLSVTYSGTTAAEAGDNVGLHGSFVAASVESGMYIFNSNTLLKAGTGCSVGANCAYINMSAIDPISPAPGRYIEIPLAPNAGTNINAIDASEEVVKFFQNGKLFIQKNGAVFDMMGTIVK